MSEVKPLLNPEEIKNLPIEIGKELELKNQPIDLLKKILTIYDIILANFPLLKQDPKLISYLYSDFTTQLVQNLSKQYAINGSEVFK